MADTFRIERSTLVDAPPEAVFPFVNDFHKWADWSPFEKMDTELKKTFTGSDAGLGATYAWDGKKSGAGRMEIKTADAPGRIVIQLDFSKPFTAHNTAEFTFERQGKGTKVTWAMTGPQTLMSKVMGLFFSMEKMVGPQFEEGLAALKGLAERAKAPA